MALGKKNERSGTRTVEVNITALIDMVFLLLIFFISVQQIAMSELAAELTLPLASQGNPELQKDRDRLIVNIDRASDIYIARTRLTMDQLRQVLLRETERGRDIEGFALRPVFIRADANLPFGTVRDVMLACRDARIWKISLRITPPREGDR